MVNNHSILKQFSHGHQGDINCNTIFIILLFLYCQLTNLQTVQTCHIFCRMLNLKKLIKKQMFLLNLKIMRHTADVLVEKMFDFRLLMQR